MIRKIATGAALTTCLLSIGAPAMAAEWRYVMSSGDRHAVEAECNQGKMWGEWSECDIRQDNGYHLFVR
ncbi:hypothetical protein [Saccharopolyspora rosea]|uniref:Uncharacterized protein n=1 Tax=Saccharopolyspora rosea TaxID=524884 RepID=A0ABW3G123_9PSEU|nr:hypothetical protein [Saccharopolyspora rosea]